MNIADLATPCLPGRFVEELKASAIRRDLADLNTFYLDGDAAVARFVEPVDIVGFTDRRQIDAQWRALRGHQRTEIIDGQQQLVTRGGKAQLRAIASGALFFQGIEPLTDEPLSWVRCKPVAPRIGYQQDDRGQWRSTEKVVKYETLKGEPLRVSYFAVTPDVWRAIAARYQVAAPTEIETNQEGAALGFWQWVQAHPEVEIVGTEGAKKALALLSAGFAAVSVPGVNCGYRVIRDSAGKAIERYLHPDLLPFANDGRKFAIAFDRDTKPETREKVSAALGITCKLLTAAGAKPFVVTWSGNAKGVDDFIASGGDITKAIAEAKPPIDVALHFARKNTRTRRTRKSDNSMNDPCTRTFSGQIPEAGIVTIVGGTGTGKTKLLTKLAAQVNAVLAPGFRVSLQRGLSGRLGLTYIKDGDRGAGHILDADGRPTWKVGLCWDSLLGVPVFLYPDGSYDLILDEADQGFVHLIGGGTCGKSGKREPLSKRALEFLLGARRVIMASATLTDNELELVEALRGERTWILENTYKANSYPIKLYRGEHSVKGSSSQARAAVVEQLAIAVKRGQRAIVPSDQLRTCRMVEQLGLELGLMPHQILRFDRETSSEEWQREFADDPDGFLAQHDIRLLTHSPSMTSGISIEGDRFDVCVGIFEGQSISPDDVLQALARVRKPIQRYVYASHWGKAEAIDETRAADFQHQLDRRTQAISNVLDRELDVVSPVRDPKGLGAFAKYYAAKMAERNEMMRDFGVYVQALLEDAGHHVTVANVDPNGENRFAAEWNRLGKLVTEQSNQEKFDAAHIDTAEAADLRQKKHLKHADALKLFRYDLCDWLAIEQSELMLEDVAFDRDGRMRRKLSRLEGLLIADLTKSKDLADLEALTGGGLRVFAHDLPGRELYTQAVERVGLREMLLAAIEAEDGWNDSTRWVREFADNMREFAADLKIACGFKVNRQQSNCAIVGMALNALGIKTETIGQFRFNGKRYRAYKIDDAALDRICEILQRRAKRHTEKGFQVGTDQLTKTLLERVCRKTQDSEIPQEADDDCPLDDDMPKSTP